MRNVPALTLVLSTFALSAACHPPSPKLARSEPESAQGVRVQGRVLIDGKPARDMNVEIKRAAGFRPDAQSVTDAEGRFALSVEGPRHVRVTIAPKGSNRSVAHVDFWGDSQVRVSARRVGDEWTFELDGAEAWPTAEAHARLVAIDDALLAETGEGLRASEPPSPEFIEAVGKHWRSILAEPREDLRALTAISVAAALVDRVGPAPFAELLTLIEPEDRQWIAVSDALVPIWPLLATPEGETYRERMRAHHDAPSLLGALLFVELREATRAGDDELARARFTELGSARFADLIWPILARGMDPDRPLRVDQPMPAFSYPSADGGTVDSASLRGKPYLLEIWATWCPACKATMPDLHRLYGEVNGVEAPEDPRTLAAVEAPRIPFVGLSIDASADTVAEFRRTQWPMPWQVVQGDDDAVRKKFHFSSTPTLVLVSAEGNIIEVAGGVSPKLREAMAALGE